MQPNEFSRDRSDELQIGLAKLEEKKKKSTNMCWWHKIFLHRASVNKIIWRQQEQQDQATIQKHFTSALTPVPGMILPQVKALLPLPPPHGSFELNSFEQIFCHFQLISYRPPEKTQGKEFLVWAVNKMEQSKAALCPVPKLCLTWTSRFLI